MKVTLPKTLDEKVFISPDEMESGEVYSFGPILAAKTNTDGIITVNYRDNDIVPFEDDDAFYEWLIVNNLPVDGELTPYQMQIIIK
ncbi:hypothetical protein bas34_0158 [Escherichia phage SelmaRatti]|uniref:Uncharacterized protein n=1 Tax=Escherichia phage SelmaRatti TaxID=2852006 RepID=A0AAE8B823_9CAUD|nr:hypothetical protein bas34_0158 [Escherichia phage SelmaRatti]